jgi:hypothetical protein
MKNDGHLGRNYLFGQEGDRINAILCVWRRAQYQKNSEGFLIVPFLVAVQKPFSTDQRIKNTPTFQQPS